MKPIQLSIAEPCHENWDQMLPEQQGKFCLGCQKNVVDFTNMSDRQVLTYFSTETGDTCGRFHNDQLDKTIALPKEKKISRWKYILQFLLPAVFAMNKAKSQSVLTMGKVRAPQQQQDTIQQKPGTIAPTKSTIEKMVILKGRVTDEKGGPVPFATIMTMDKQHGVSADADGNFILKSKEVQGLRASAAGYQDHELPSGLFMATKGFQIGVENGATVMSGLVIQLKTAAINLEDVLVVGYAVVRRSAMTGGAVAVYHLDSLERTLKKKPVPKSIPVSLKIYPNPIRPGQDFNIIFNVAATGHYLLEILDASGKLITAQPLDIQTKGQAEAIDGSRLQQSGIYIINLKNEDNKPVFNGKLVVG